MGAKGPGLPSYTGKDVGVAASISSTDEAGEAFHAYATDTLDLPRVFPEEKALGCAATFHSLGMKKLGESIGVACPGDCMHAGELIGTTLYPPGVNVCRAARHAGIIGSEGGHAMVTRGFGQDAYFGSKFHRDTSVDGHKTDISYRLSFPIPQVMARMKAKTY